MVVSAVPMRSDLHEDKAVLAMARGLKIPELHVVGCLYRIWGWVGEHTEDGTIPARIAMEIDRMAAVPGFGSWMRAEGLIEVVTPKEIRFPYVTDWLARTARKRKSARERQAKRQAALKRLPPEDITRDANITRDSRVMCPAKNSAPGGATAYVEAPKDITRDVGGALVSKGSPAQLERSSIHISDGPPQRTVHREEAQKQEDTGTGSGREDASIITRQEIETRQVESCQNRATENQSPALGIFDPPEADSPKKTKKKQAPSTPTPLSVGWAAHLEAWNAIARKHGRPTIQDLHDRRRLHLRGRLVEHPELWKEIDEALSKLGAFAREQRFITFDWLMRPANLTKLLEGNYSEEQERVGRPAPVDPDAYSRALEEERRKIRREMSRTGS